MSQNLSLSKTKKFSLPTIRSAYSEKCRVIANMDGPSRTKQSFKEECDVNNIMRKFTRTGVLDFTNRNQARYGDCTGLDFQGAMDVVSRARSMFEELPATLRARFDNDPGEFLEFVGNAKNRDEARELGLLKPEEQSDDSTGGSPVRGTQEPVQGSGGAGSVRPAAGRKELPRGDAGDRASTLPPVVKDA